MVDRLGGKVALISGAARGQGAAEAHLFAQEGAKVVLADVRVDEGQGVANAIERAGGTAVFVKLDVTLESDWDAAVERTVRQFGALSILVNNAGISRPPGIEATTLELWNEVIGVNQTGTFLGMRAAIPVLRATGGGSIVNVASVCALIGTGTAAAYHASKGAIHSLTKTVALEVARDGIRVNAIYPGAIDTAMVDDVLGEDPDERQRVVDLHPLGRFGTPDEVALAVLYLASDESSFVTGSGLVIDGGNTAW